MMGCSQRKWKRKKREDRGKGGRQWFIGMPGFRLTLSPGPAAFVIFRHDLHRRLFAMKEGGVSGHEVRLAP